MPFLPRLAEVSLGRSARKRTATPKGEAQKSLEHANRIVRDLEAYSNPGEEQVFIDRFNDFLRCAKTVIPYLKSESDRPPGLSGWVRDQDKCLHEDNESYSLLIKLRNISEKDCIVGPESTLTAVIVEEHVMASGTFETKLRNTRGQVTGYATCVAPPGVTNQIPTKVSVKYFLTSHSEQDIVSLCKSVLSALQDLVARAYAEFA